MPWIILCILWFIMQPDCRAQLKSNQYIYQKASVQFWYPDNWIIESSEDALMLKNEGDDLSLTFSVMEADKIQEALMELELLLKEQMSEATVLGEPQVLEFNNLRALSMDLEGYMNELKVKVGIFLVDCDTQVLLVMGVGYQQALDRQHKALYKIINSIKLIN